MLLLTACCAVLCCAVVFRTGVSYDMMLGIRTVVSKGTTYTHIHTPTSTLLLAHLLSLCLPLGARCVLPQSVASRMKQLTLGRRKWIWLMNGFCGAASVAVPLCVPLLCSECRRKLSSMAIR